MCFCGWFCGGVFGGGIGGGVCEWFGVIGCRGGAASVFNSGGNSGGAIGCGSVVGMIVLIVLFVGM